MEINKKYSHTSNYKSGRSGTIQYIVLHYTANNGDTAWGNCNYFAGANRQSSANYFVDETSIWQCVKDKDTAWHCGGGLQGKAGHAFYGKCKNSNSIGVEMCNSVNGVPKAVEENALWLVRMLMEKYNVPIERVIRHYDVTGKLCPKPWVQNESEWLRFKNRIQEEMPMTAAERVEFDNLKKSVNDLTDIINGLVKNNKKYNSVEDIPSWGKQTIAKLVERNELLGTGNGLNLDENMLRILIIVCRILDKAGVFK